MAEATPTKIRVVLRWVQVLDKLEPWFKEKGEFVFRAEVSTKNGGGQSQKTRMPEEGHYAVSDHPRFNKLNLMDRVLFEGEVVDHLAVELRGEELDDYSDNDHLDLYVREFNGPIAEFIGRHQPGDEGEHDPENLQNWRVCYDIEPAD